MTTSFSVFQLLLVVLHAASSSREQLKVAFTMRKLGFGDEIGPAMLEPLETIKTKLEVDVNWTIIDTKNSTSTIVSEFFFAISEFKPHVIIGEQKSDCCEIMATLASAIDRLFISVGCHPFQFVMDTESYPTYASAMPTAFSFGNIVISIMKKFEWTRVGIVSTANNQYPIRVRHLKTVLKQNNKDIFSYVHAASNNTREDFELRKNSVKVMLEFLAGRATLFVFVMDHSEAKFVLECAKDMGYFNGNHAFLLDGLFEDLGIRITDKDLEAFEGMMTMDRDTTMDGSQGSSFKEQVREGFDSQEWTSKTGGNWARSPDFDKDTAQQKSNMLSAGYLHDGVLLWLNALTSLKQTNKEKSWDEIANMGPELAHLSKEVTFQGVAGTIVIKEGISMSSWNVSLVQKGKPKTIMQYFDANNGSEYMNLDTLEWLGGGTTAPIQPECFDDQCKKDHRLLIIICSSLAGAIVAIVLIGFLISILWKRLQEKQIITNWKIIWSDVAVIADVNTNTSASSSADHKSNTGDHRSLGSSGVGRLYIAAGMYKGSTIAIKAIPRDSVNIFERTVYKELKQLLYVKHDNLNPFLGVCVDAPNVCVAMAYAEKGSIQNVLADQQFDIDWEFRMSLALDVVQGMEYLHSTPVGAHGHLTSSNCVIDERWVCKITDYGLKMFRCLDKLQRPLIDLLWTAPEILRKKENDSNRVHGTKPADVYSFGIIISELLSRELPYQTGMGSATLEELLAKVKLSLEPPFRPHLPAMEGHIAAEWIGLAKNCWQTAPHKRPTFRTVKSILLANHSGKFTNVLERMQMMLEESIERANTDLLVERRKTEAMLESILPRPIVEKIASGTEFEPQLSDAVTLCLCDTIGFYKATNALPADVVVDVLKVMYRQYDEIVGKYDAFEINTSGGRDSMMLTGGLSINPKVDSEAICTMSLELLSFIGTFTHPRIESKDIQMKITINTGSAYAALMGKQMPQLHVFGEVIAATTHLHSFGSNMSIRISNATRERLPIISGFKIEKGDDVQFQGSLVTMYVVTGKDGFTKPLPSPKVPANAPRRKSSTVKRKSSGPKAAKQ